MCGQRSNSRLLGALSVWRPNRAVVDRCKLSADLSRLDAHVTKRALRGVGVVLERGDAETAKRLLLLRGGNVRRCRPAATGGTTTIRTLMCPAE